MVISAACSGLNVSRPKRTSSVSDSDDYILNHQVNPAGKSDLADNFDEDIVQKLENSLSDDDYVNYIIEVDDASLYTMYKENTARTKSYQEYVSSRSARINAENMQKRHNVFYKQISRHLEAEFVASYTGLFNAFAVSIKYGDRHDLKKIVEKNKGISLSISERYDMPTYETVHNEVDVHDTGIFKRPNEEETGLTYKGEGMLVAVLDTGLDYTHPAFSTDNLPEDKSIIRSKEEIKTVVPDLIANRYTVNLDVNDVYVNEKVPFAYDYADFDTEVNTTEENSHGTHVSGIIVGRSADPKVYNPETGEYGPKYDKEGRVMTGIEGVAPLAQVAAMKVFSDFKSGAEDIYLYSAIHDCAVLNVDVINMSLGRGSGFSDVEEHPLTQKVYEAINEMGISLVVAAGNGFSAGRGGHWGLNLTSNPDSGTVGSPSTYYQSFSVASINGVESDYMLSRDKDGNEIGIAYMTESGKPNGEKYDFIEDLIKAIKGENRDGIDYSSQYYNEATGEISIPYVTIPGIGDSTSYGSVGDVTGKIALIERGKITFTDKLIEAYNNGAIAAVIYNNVGGIISMSIEDNMVTLPSCSITMDAAANIKGVRGGTLNFMDKIKGKYSAGPFMSDFSSWGPTNSLELKPEITGHGGEIYSAFPGEDNYSRISGTSMAAPNVAGLVTLARQHLTAFPEKYGVLTNGKVDYTKVEPRVYQLMMSTATIPRDENGNPYSPRKIGAGLADITALLTTDAYLYVTDDGSIANATDSNVKDRTKLELFDDPERTGIYEMDFYIRNMGSRALTYKLRAITMTESMATDYKTVAELSYMLDNTQKEWKFNDQVVSGETITVESGSDAKISLKLTLTEEDKDYIERTFANGMYVEGFVRLDAVTEGRGAANLGIPYLAFYGDWNDAPMFDYSIYETDMDDKDPGLNDNQKRYSQGRPTMLLAKLIENGNDYVMPAGQLIFTYPDEYEYERPYATEDKTVLSFNKESLHELYYVSGFLRGAKTVNWEIRNAHTGELMAKGFQPNVRKDAMYSNLGGILLEVSPEAIGCKNGGTYTFSFTADLDYPKSDGMESHSWHFNFGIDTDAPLITNTELRVEKDFRGNYKRYLDFYIHDDNYLQAMSFSIFDKFDGEYHSIWDKGLRPLISDKNATTRVSFDLNQYWQQIKDNDYKIETRIYDFALNCSYYEIDLSKMLYTGAESIEFADIGTYMSFEKEESLTYKMLMDYYDKIQYKEDGSYDTMTSINLVPNQSVKLEHALVTKPANVWVEDIVWSTSNPSVVRINERTGEIFSVREGTAEIRATSKSNSRVFAQLDVRVVSERIMSEYGIPEARASTMRLQQPMFIDQAMVDGNYLLKTVRAGEVFELEVQPNPYYLDLNELEIEWRIGNNRLAQIEVHEDNPLKATITVNKGTYDDQGNYTKNNTGVTAISVIMNTKSAPANKQPVSLYIRVLEEFVVQAAELKEYNGSDSEVIIPGNLNIQTIGDYCFTNRKDITKVVVPEGVEKIGRASFAYMFNLREVILPSSIKVISEWAFAAYSSAISGIQTSLNIVDTRSFIHPVDVGGRAFVNNQVLGTNLTMVNSNILEELTVDSLLSVNYFDTSKFRTVGHYALAGCVFLTELDLSGLRAVGGESFRFVGYMAAANAEIFGDKAFTNITFSEDTHVSPLSLYVTGARKLEIPMRRIPVGSFAESIFLEELVFTADNLIVEPQAFTASPELKSITFKGSVDYIGDFAFSHSNVNGAPKGLHTLVFEKDVRYIGSGAFYAATELDETLTLPNGLEYLGQSAFGNCININKLIIPKGLTADLDFKGAFFGTNLQTIEVEDGNPKYSVSEEIMGQPDILIKSLGNDEYEMVLVPYAKELDDHFIVPDKVTIIGDSAFGFNKHLKSIDLNKVKVVKESAMSNMAELESVRLSDNMTEIPDAMFVGCINLTEVTNTAHIKKVGEYAFYGTAIDTIDLSSCESLGRYVFALSEISSFVIPTAVTEIPDYAFYSTANLSNVEFHSGITRIGEFAFAGRIEVSYTMVGTVVDEYLNQLTEISIETDGELEIGYCAFLYGHNLERINLPKATKIGAGAFAVNYGEGKLASVSLPQAEHIGMGAFENQTELVSISLPNVKVIDDYAFTGSGLTSINMPKATTIGRGVFYNCEDLAGNFVIPKTVEYIGPLAFAQTGITSFSVQIGSGNYKAIDGVLFRILPEGMELSHYPVGGDREDLSQNPKDYVVNLYEIPEGTTRIAENAFSTVRSLNKVTLPSTLTHIGHKAFFGSSVSVYEFKSMFAPVLEAMYSYFDNDDLYDYYWAEYANFYSYFSPTATGMLGFQNPFDGSKITVFAYNYRYNTITGRYYADTWIANKLFLPANRIFKDEPGLAGLNDSITGGGDNRQNAQYGLVMIRPGNGMGYTSFVYTYYFDEIIIGQDIMENSTQNLINRIDALPETSKFTLEYRSELESLLSAYKKLSLGQKELVYNAAKLDALEKKMQELISGIKYYHVSFYHNGEIYGNVQTIEQNGLVSQPTPPVLAGYTFDGWYLGEEKFDFSTPVKSNMILTAKFISSATTFTVSFSGEGVEIDSQTVEINGLVQKPADPKRSGYKFEGWYIGEEEFDFDTPITSDIELVAKWSKSEGCGGCGTVAFGSGFGGGTIVALLLATILIALGAALLLKKRQHIQE